MPRTNEEEIIIARLNNAVINLCKRLFDFYGSCEDCDHKICCTADAPSIYNHEMEKMARTIGMNVKKFKKKYVVKLNLPVLNRRLRTPCPFLGVDRHCSIYDARPKACRMFPFESSMQVGTIRLESITLCQIATQIGDDFSEFCDENIESVPETEEMKKFKDELERSTEQLTGIISETVKAEPSHENFFIMTSPLFFVCFCQYKMDGVKDIKERFKRYQINPELLLEYIMKFE